jgi:hypothetical protein
MQNVRRSFSPFSHGNKEQNSCLSQIKLSIFSISHNINPKIGVYRPNEPRQLNSKQIRACRSCRVREDQFNWFRFLLLTLILEGKLAKESIDINKSLFTLRQVITTLSDSCKRKLFYSKKATSKTSPTSPTETPN